MKKNLSFFISGSILSLFIGFISFSCSKKPEQIGSNIQPDKDLIGYAFTDTVSIVAYSEIEDSVRTDEPTNVLLGSIKDPVFGTSAAGFYTQFRLSTSGHDFGENPSLDSLVLQLSYSGFYGDSSTIQTIKVYELQEQLYIDSSYFSNTIKAFNPVELATYQFSPRPNTPYQWEGDTLDPLIRIRLSDLSTNLGDRLLSADSTALSSASDFQQYFNGLYLMADPVVNNGGIAYFNLPITASRLTIHYHNTEQDSLRYEFYITSTDARFNYFDHFEYQDASPEFISQVLNQNTDLGKQKLYLQTMAGIKTKFKFPNMTRFADTIGKNVIINEAKLLLNGFESGDELFTPPAQLALVKSSTDGTYTITEDQYEGAGYFGGVYDSVSNQYQFRITHYIQDLVLNNQEETDDGLYVFIIGASSKYDRWIINGINPVQDSASPLQLQLIYSTVSR